MPATFIDRVAIDARGDGAFRAEVHLGGEPVPGRSLRAEIVDARSPAVGVPVMADVGAGAVTATLDARALLTGGHAMKPDHAHPIFSADGRRVLVQSGRLTGGASLDLAVVVVPPALLGN